MPSGLVALLDDIAGIAKLAAASLDDIGAAAGKAGSKAVGVVIDDTAVTPRYVTGLSPERELPIIAKIARGSLRNKLLFLLPAGLLLTALAPWALTPLLMIGGAYLCFEGAEKVLEALGGGHQEAREEAPSDPATLEQEKVSGAIRTDFILSAEIMAIALADVAAEPLWEQAIVLVIVALGITAGVYGVVALLVKLDDIGLHLAKRSSAAAQALGRGMVHAMPPIMRVLSIVGTAAMIWVGGGILLHGAEGYGLAAPAHVIHHAGEVAAHAVPALGGVLAWLVGAAGAGVIGLVVGAIVAGVVHLIPRKGH
jgi:predicted DNA repair protein MutK